MPSTVIRNIHYEPESERLFVTFVSGREYRYDQVPADVYHLFRLARSKGEFFNCAIRDHYLTREVTPDPQIAITKTA